MKQARHYALIVLGSLSLLLGALGVLLPVLPTTPFLLLAALCYMRSSPRLHRWLMGHRVFGPYIHSYVEHRAVTRTNRRIALIVLWSGILFSIWVTEHPLVKGGLLLIASLVTLHLLRLKTMSAEHGKS